MPEFINIQSARLLEKQENQVDEFGSAQFIVTAGAEQDAEEDDGIEEDIVICADEAAIMNEEGPIEEDISASAQTNQILPQGILSTE